MKVFRSFSIPKKFNDSVIAIGNFDGLHLGHQEVINEAQKISLKFKKKVQDLQGKDRILIFSKLNVD